MVGGPMFRGFVCPVMLAHPPKPDWDGPPFVLSKVQIRSSSHSNILLLSWYLHTTQWQCGDVVVESASCRGDQPLHSP
jgi:hypothetical protein